MWVSDEGRVWVSENFGTRKYTTHRGAASWARGELASQSTPLGCVCAWCVCACVCVCVCVCVPYYFLQMMIKSLIAIALIVSIKLVNIATAAIPCPQGKAWVPQGTKNEIYFEFEDLDYVRSCT